MNSFILITALSYKSILI